MSLGAGGAAPMSACSAGRCASSTIAGPEAQRAVATLQPGDVAHPRKYPLPCRRGEERPGARQRHGGARRFLRQRRLLRRPPRPRLDRGRRPSAAGLCRPGDGGGAEGARSGARRSRAAGRGGRRRRQGLDQARRAPPPRRQGRSSDHRRRHGQHLPRRARRRCRQVALRARSRRRPRDEILDAAERAGLHRPSAL